MASGYDSRCLELARVFIGDEPMLQKPGNAERLAQEIQDRIEDWIREQKRDAK